MASSFTAHPGIHVAESGSIWKDCEQNIGPPKPRCERSHWGLCGTGVSAVKAPLSVPDITPLYLCLPSIWGTVGGDILLDFHYLELLWKSEKIKTGHRDSRESRDSLTGRLLQQETRDWDSSAGSWGLWHQQWTSFRASRQGQGQTSCEKPRTSLFRASSSSTYAEGRLRCIAPGVGRLHLAKSWLSRLATHNLRKAKGGQEELGA
jgi:hypothetical protein